MITVKELRKRWKDKAYGHQEKYYDDKVDEGMLVLMCMLGGIITLMDVVLVVGS